MLRDVFWLRGETEMRFSNSWWITAAAALALAGCGPSGGGGQGTNVGATGELDVASFQGGYGIDFFQQAAKEYEAKHPGVTIKVTGGPRVWEQLRPRFIAGNPPDLTWPGWGFDYWPAVYEGQVLALDDYLKQPNPYNTGKDAPKTWGESFEPALLKLGQYDGKQYLLPYHYNMNGWWYNPDLFAKNGWQPPKTFQELLDLCAKIKAKGIAPITYQGKYPYYMIAGFLFPWAVSVGGVKVTDDAQSIVPGAWKSPAMLQAATMIKELKDRGYFEEGANALSHTESQMDFLNGKAAMIPCGTWLYSEMKNQMPAGAKMRFMLPPVVAGGQGDPNAILIGIEPWIVPTKGKNHDLAIDFYKFMTSIDKAHQFVQEKGTLMAIKGSDKPPLPDYLVPAAEAFRSSKTVYSSEYRQWYPELGTESENAMAALLNGEITPEQFCDRCEAAAEKTRNDKTLKRHTMTH